jgi:hypothetical protein
MVREEQHKLHSMDIVGVVHRIAEAGVQEMHRNLVPVGNSVSAGTAEGARRIVEQEALEKHHSPQLQPDSTEVEGIVGTDLAEDIVPEVDWDSEEGIDLERGTGQLADRKGPRTEVDLHMEAGRALCAVASDTRCNLLKFYGEG